MDYIDIKGYKSIKDLHLELNPINILIGANGAGKSNFISFFGFLKTAYDQLLRVTVAKNGGVDKYLHNGRKNTAKISCKLSFDGGECVYGFTLDTGVDSFFVLSEMMNEWTAIKGSSSNPELNIKTIGFGGQGSYIRDYLNGLKVYHFQETGINSPFNSDPKINDYHILQSYGANIASFLYHLKQNDPIIYNRIVKVIQSIAPYFLDFELKPNTEGSEYIRLAWKDKYSENLYGVTDFSDGTIRFIALATLFLQPKPPTVIIIDEPELGLHPFAINKLAGLVQAVASKGTQVILSTQSVELVNCFSPEDIITVDNIDGVSTFERLDSKKLAVWLNDYAVGDMWRQNLLDKGFPNK